MQIKRMDIQKIKEMPGQQAAADKENEGLIT